MILGAAKEKRSKVFEPLEGEFSGRPEQALEASKQGARRRRKSNLRQIVNIHLSEGFSFFQKALVKVKAVT